MIGGNSELIVQVLSDKENYDENGKRIIDYISKEPILGWIDLVTGDSRYDNKAKIEESTHIFICDYTDKLNGIDIEKSRAIVDGEFYDIKYIDDVMKLHEHFEIYLKKVGGQ